MCIRDRSKTIVGSPSLSSERFIRLDAPIVFLQPQCAKSTAPVSYTPLDVYKRQLLHFPMAEIISVLNVKILFMLPLVKKQIDAVSRQTAGQCNINLSLIHI